MADVQKGMLIAMTGATGFLGGSIASSLVQDGYRVRVLKRRADAPVGLVDSVENQVATVIGDLDDKDALDRLMEGADAAIHVAGMFRSEGAYADFERVNRDGALNALEAAIKAKVKRYVHTSTGGVHGAISGVADENAPFNPMDAYQESKLKGEMAVRSRAQNEDIELVVVRPTAIYGPGDHRMLKMFTMIQKGSFFLVGKASPNFHPVYIDDLVDGYRRVLRTPKVGGETFIIGGPRALPLSEYLGTAARVLEAAPPSLRIPYAPMYVAARLCEALFPLLGRQPPLHRRRLGFFINNRSFSTAKARAVLGHEPKVDLDEGFSRTVAWYRSAGLLR
jgi:dihydroflavonol-4-reductase